MMLNGNRIGNKSGNNPFFPENWKDNDQQWEKVDPTFIIVTHENSEHFLKDFGFFSDFTLNFRDSSNSKDYSQTIVSEILHKPCI